VTNSEVKFCWAIQHEQEFRRGKGGRVVSGQAACRADCRDCARAGRGATQGDREEGGRECSCDGGGSEPIHRQWPMEMSLTLERGGPPLGRAPRRHGTSSRRAAAGLRLPHRGCLGPIRVRRKTPAWMRPSSGKRGRVRVDASQHRRSERTLDDERGSLFEGAGPRCPGRSHPLRHRRFCRETRALRKRSDSPRRHRAARPRQPRCGGAWTSPRVIAISAGPCASLFRI